MIRILMTWLCCILAGIIFSIYIKWDWSFILIPTLILLAVSLSNFDRISFPKKLTGILLHCFLSIVIFIITMGITSIYSFSNGIVCHVCWFGSSCNTIYTYYKYNIVFPKILAFNGDNNWIICTCMANSRLYTRAPPI